MFFFRLWYRGGATLASLLHDLGGRLSLQRLAAEEPWSVRKRMLALDTTLLHCQAQRPCADSHELGCVGECQPVSRSARFRVDGNAVFATQRGDTATCPAIAPAGSQAIAIQDASD